MSGLTENSRAELLKAHEVRRVGDELVQALRTASQELLQADARARARLLWVQGDLTKVRSSPGSICVP